MVEYVLWTGLALLSSAYAGPLDRFPRAAEDYQALDLSAYENFTANEVCFSDNQVFQKGAVMPNPGPCEECRCEPPSIVCQMVKCPVNHNGCRTIQRANHCCPDYNCECDYNGQLYGDGERIEVPDQPCQVCYCKGGEVMCTSLTCYTRDDCQPRHVPGQCCPKYTDCPLRDMASPNGNDNTIPAVPVNKTGASPKREMQPWLLTNSARQTSSAPVTATDDGLVVVVSDWLTERKTTPENDGVDGNTKLRENPATESPTRSTKLPTKGVYSNGSKPVDEVIFTRIGLPKDKDDVVPSPHVDLNLLEETETTSNAAQTTNTDAVTSDSSHNDNVISVTPNYVFTTVNENYTHNMLSENEEINTDQPPNDLFSKDQIDVIKSIHSEDLDTNKEVSTVTTIKGDTKEGLILISNHNKSMQQPIEQIIEDSDTSQSNDKNKLEMMNESQNDNLKYSEEKEVQSKFKDAVSQNPHRVIPSLHDLKLSTPKPLVSLDNSVNNSFKNNKEHATTSLHDLETTTNNIDVTTNLNNNKDKQGTILEISTKGNLNSTVMSQPGIDVDNVEFTNVLMELTTPYLTEDHIDGIKEISDNSRSGAQVDISNQSIFHPTQTREENLFKLPDGSKSQESQTETNDVIENTTLLENVKPEFRDVPETKIASTSDLLEKEAEFLIEEVTVNGITNDKAYYISTESSIVTYVPTQEGSQDEPEDTREQLPNHSDKKIDDEVALGISKSDQSDESFEVNTDKPPILELNSHVPFLVIGGPESSDESDSNEVTDGLIPPDKSQFTENLSTTSNIFESTTVSNTAELTKEKILNEHLSMPSSTNIENGTIFNSKNITMILNDVQSTASTPHIPLTPGDLKIIAEHIINEKITPVNSSKDPAYSPTQWLQGNLTSEENLASIMAAANISIGIINKDMKEQNQSIATILPVTGKLDKAWTPKENIVNDSGQGASGKEKSIYDKYVGKTVSYKRNLMADNVGINNNDSINLKREESHESTKSNNLNINNSYDSSDKGSMIVLNSGSGISSRLTTADVNKSTNLDDSLNTTEKEVLTKNPDDSKNKNVNIEPTNIVIDSNHEDRLVDIKRPKKTLQASSDLVSDTFILQESTTSHIVSQTNALGVA